MRKSKILLIATLLIFVFAGCMWGGGSSTNNLEATKPYIDRANKIVDDMATDLNDAIDVYTHLTQLLPVNDPMRTKILDYIMRETLKLVDSQKKDDVDRGLALSMDLYKLLPGDYYVQNRIIQAYIFYAKQEMAKRNWAAADEWVVKALHYRFHIEAMRTHINILMGKAKDLIAAKKPDDAKAALNQAISIINTDDNNKIYVNELADAQKLLETIK